MEISLFSMRNHDVWLNPSSVCRGLRGIVGETLTPDVAMRYVGAFAATLGAGPVVVTRRTGGRRA